jgi:hypothetical protein
MRSWGFRAAIAIKIAAIQQVYLHVWLMSSGEGMPL